MSWVIAAVPLISGLAMGQLCPVRDTDPKAAAQPPGIVFGIVWPLLYLALGISWWRSRKRANVDVWFVLIVGSLLLWQYLYGCAGQPKLALYTLVASIALTLATALWISKLDRVASVLLAPLIAWLIFATLLNAQIVAQPA